MAELEWRAIAEWLILAGAVAGALRLLLAPVFKAAHQVSTATEQVTINAERLTEVEERQRDFTAQSTETSRIQAETTQRLAEIVESQGLLKELVGQNGDGRSILHRIDDLAAETRVSRAAVARAVNSHAVDDQGCFEALAEWAEAATGTPLKLPDPRFVPLDESEAA